METASHSGWRFFFVKNFYVEMLSGVVGAINNFSIA